MPSYSYARLALAFGLVVAIQTPLHAADHGHINAGAVGTNQNDRLLWANGADFIASFGYVKTLDFTNAGPYAGYYQQNITLTALPTTAAHAGPDPQAPAPGSFLRARMACLESPVGGYFGFWEGGATNPTISVTAGDSSTNTWALSQNDVSPGSDPYGHIHGRRFTATKAGLYRITFQAIDTSTNGANGGPIHTPSTPLPVWFQAGVHIVEIEPDYEEGHVHVHFGGRLNYTWQVEFTPLLGSQADWRPAGHPIVGDDVFIEMIHEGDPPPKGFYRVVGTPIAP